MKNFFVSSFLIIGTLYGLADSGQNTTSELNYVIDSYDENAAMVTIPDFENRQVKYKGNIVIPDKIEVDGVTFIVKGIDKYAFNECDVKLSLPSTIEHIDAMALYGVELEEDVNLPNLNEVGPMAMMGCTGVKKLTIGPKLEVVGEAAFGGIMADEFVIESGGNEALLWTSNEAFTLAVKEELRLPRNGELDLGDCFCGGMKRVVFPDIEEIKYGPGNCWSEFLSIHKVFGYMMANIEEVVCLGTTPPRINIPQDFLNGEYYGQTSTQLYVTDNMDECVLKVPAGSEALYRADPIWGLFKNIYGFSGSDYTSIMTPEIECGENDTPVTYYNLQGMQVREPVRGQMYIRYGGGHAEKIVY